MVFNRTIHDHCAVENRTYVFRYYVVYTLPRKFGLSRAYTPVKSRLSIWLHLCAGMQLGQKGAQGVAVAAEDRLAKLGMDPHAQILFDWVGDAVIGVRLIHREI